MNPFIAVKLMKKYLKCEKCGNENVGDGEGALNISDDIFIRTCKCGWKVEIKTDDKK